MRVQPEPPAPPRNITKAIVRREEQDGVLVVVKDYSSRPLWVRFFYGRPSLRREVRTYRRLEGIPGIPRCLGLRSPDELILEHIEAQNLRCLPPESVSPELFDRLESLLHRIHARGVAMADLHRSNVLVSGVNAVHLIDFAFARMSPVGRRPGWWVRSWQKLDLHAAARLRSRYLGTPEPRPTGLFGICYRAIKALKPARRKTTSP